MLEINFDRIRRAQQLMTRQGMIGLMILTRDDYVYFFGDLRVQPRAIIPVAGDPILIAFSAEEPELKKLLGDAPVRIFQDVGGQMTGVRRSFKELMTTPYPQGFSLEPGQRPRVGMQLWFDTPAFLVELFRKLNRDVDLVSSDPVMDELRMVKDPAELERLRTAQQIATMGMDRARAFLKPGATAHQVATEALYTMMKAGAEGTSTPIHVNTGLRSCWLHGTMDRRPIEQGDTVVVDLTPKYEGYCANLARTFVVGKPDEQQRLLYTTYLEMVNATRAALKPGATPMELDLVGKRICDKVGLGEFHLDGISHGIGLRFEETPASTIIKAHRRVALKEGMTVTVGHTILAIPGIAGVRVEDIYRVTPQGGEVLAPYPSDSWEVEV